MKLSYLLAGSVILLLYAAVNYYIGIRGWQSLGRFIPRMNRTVYWSLFAFLAFSYFVSRFAERILPEPAANILNALGSYWLAAMLYFAIILLSIDLLRVIAGLASFLLPAAAKGHLTKQIEAKKSLILPTSGISVILLTAGILAYGTWNAMNPRISKYELSIDKKAGWLSELHIAMVSDMHLGTAANNNKLVKMVGMLNRLESDIVVLAGDIVDEDVNVFIQQGLEEILRDIESKYGVFAVLGNHEYYGGHSKDIEKRLESVGVNVLRDETVLIEGSFYIAGREDAAARRAAEGNRMDMDELLENLDRAFPIILLSHQPVDLEEASLQGADIQLSGHTHNGQLFPLNFITGLLFEQDWGYLRKGDMHLIVSSGFGTWGPPLRVGNYPEVVSIKIRFK